MRTETRGEWTRTRAREAYRWFKLSHVGKKARFDQFGERFRFTKFFTGWEILTRSRLAGSFSHFLAGSWNFANNHAGGAERLFIF